MQKTHTIVAVPLLILNQAQKKGIERQATKHLRFQYRTEHLYPDGAAFGAREQWRDFLCVEKFKDVCGDRTSAVKIAAWLGQNPGQCFDPNDKALLSRALAIGDRTKRGRRNNVRKNCRIIKDQIEAIFLDLRFLAYC